jgi:hypothetical protein
MIEVWSFIMLRTIRDYMRFAAPEPEVLSTIGEESWRKSTDMLTSRQIDRAVTAARVQKPTRG